MQPETVNLEYIHWRNSVDDPIIVAGYALPGRRDLKRAFTLSRLLERTPFASAAMRQAVHDEFKQHADAYVRFRQGLDGVRGDKSIHDWQETVNIEWEKLRAYIRTWQVIRDPVEVECADHGEVTRLEYRNTLARVEAPEPRQNKRSFQSLSRKSSSASLASCREALSEYRGSATVMAN